MTHALSDPDLCVNFFSGIFPELCTGSPFNEVTVSGSLHCWFSQKAVDINQKYYVYERADGTLVEVTTVSYSPDCPYIGGMYEADAQYRGLVEKFVVSRQTYPLWPASKSVFGSELGRLLNESLASKTPCDCSVNDLMRQGCANPRHC